MAQNEKFEMLDQELADQMLSNIFDICEIKPNTIPLEELESYSNYRKDKYRVRKSLLVLIMVIFLLVPLLFMSPKIMTLKQLDSTSPTYSMNIESILPVTSVVATIDGENVPVYEKAKHEYTIEPSKVGDMLVTVKCVNRQYAQKKIKVTNIDKQAPTISSSKKKDGKIYIYLEDNLSGVDYENIYAKNTSGKTIKPESFNEEKSLVVFTYPSESINIFVPDKAGNTLQLLLSIS
ncbi:MAG: hypothetical protein MJ127_04210 [Mogibacterium sp.]|nr:hypothetical protein [Mogibacterium sp.]